MRATGLWPLLVVAVAAAAQHAEDDHAWVEEDLDSYSVNLEDDGEGVDHHARPRRYAQYDPYDEHVRVKRRCEDEDEPAHRVRRSHGDEYIRRPRQVHQYEVHESNDDSFAPSAAPYEEMLAASAEHYHRVYVAPGAPAAARYLQSPVSVDQQVPPGRVTPVPVAVYRQAVSSKQPAAAAPVTNNVSPISFTNVSPINVVPAPVSVLNSVPIAKVSPFGAIPVASVPVFQPSQAYDDQSVAGAHHHHHQNHHNHGHAQGGGHKKLEHHHRQHGAKSSKGFHNDEHVVKGGKGHKSKEVHRKEYEEADGKKRKHHDNADHKGSHEEEAHGHRGSKFDEKKGHKKGHKTKGYHNKYHKDEFHKEHKFYDDYHKSGEHHRFGKFHAKHASDERGKKKAHHVDAGHDYVERGKKGYSNKGHVDSDHKGHKGKHGHEEHHDHHEQHGKKGGKQGASHWGHQQ